MIQGTSVFGINNKASLIVPVSIIQEGENVSTTALIDSGTQGIFIDNSIANKLDLEELGETLTPRNIDGTVNSGGDITHYTLIKIVMGDKPFWVKAYVTNLGCSHIFLGDNWLQAVNLQINWPKRHITINTLSGQDADCCKAEMQVFLKRPCGVSQNLMDMDNIELN